MMHTERALPWLSGAIWLLAAVNLAISTFIIVFGAAGGTEEHWMYPAFQAAVAVVTTEVLFVICVIHGRKGNKTMRNVSVLLLSVSAASQIVKVIQSAQFTTALDWTKFAIALIFGGMSVIGVAVLAYFDDGFPRETVHATTVEVPIVVPDMPEPEPVKMPKPKQIKAPRSGSTNDVIQAIIDEHPEWSSTEVHAELLRRKVNVTRDAVRKSRAWKARSVQLPALSDSVGEGSTTALTN
jgi:hypothetical protein